MIENTRTPHVLAHPGKRFQGRFIDGLVAYIIGIGIYFALKAISNGGIALILGMAAGLIYFLFSDALPNGQSIGKRVLDIKVIDKNTTKPCSIAQSFLRNNTFILGAIDWLFIFFGSHRRLGDFIANTIVVKLIRNAA